jgi:hypothetical protein
MGVVRKVLTGSCINHQNRTLYYAFWKIRVWAMVHDRHVLRLVVELQKFIHWWNRCLNFSNIFRHFINSDRWLSQLLFLTDSCCFTNGRDCWFWNCHVACGHQKMAVFTSTVPYINSTSEMEPESVNLNGDFIWGCRHLLELTRSRLSLQSKERSVRPRS